VNRHKMLRFFSNCSKSVCIMYFSAPIRVELLSYVSFEMQSHLF